MKYKNIELIPGTDSSAELLVHILISDDADDDFMEYVEISFLIDLPYHIRCFHADISHPIEHLITVRIPGGINFDCDGVEFLINRLYKEVETFVKSDNDKMTVKIGVHVDGLGKEFVFFKEDGSWYNEDSVTPEEFLANIEY